MSRWPMLECSDESGAPEAAQSDHLRAQILRAGFTERDLADAFGVSEDTVGDWCEGRTAVPDRVLLALQHLLR